MTASVLKQYPNTQKVEKKEEEKKVFIITKHKMRNFGVSCFIKLQNNL